MALPFPTAIDLMHGAFYAENATRAQYRPQIIDPYIKKMNVEGNVSVIIRDFTKEEIGEFVNSSKLNRHSSAVWKSIPGKNIAAVCQSLSCNTYTYEGDTCLPTTAPHRSINITGQEIDHCQKSCYIIPQHSIDAPTPTMPLLKIGKHGKDDKCLIQNPNSLIWITNPFIRDTKHNPGFTNVPMFKELDFQKQWPEAMAEVTQKYCEWFGMFLTGSGPTSDCKADTGTKILSMFTGDVIARYTTQGQSIGRVRSQNYSYVVPLENVNYNIPGMVDSLPEGHHYIKNLRKLFIENSKTMPITVEKLMRGEFITESSRLAAAKLGIVTKENVDNYTAAFTSRSDNWFEQGIFDTWVGDILKEVLITEFVDRVIIQSLQKGLTSILKRLTGTAAKTTWKAVSSIASKLLVESIMKTLILKTITKTALMNAAKAIALALGKLALAVTNFISLCLLVIGLSGLVLDLVGVGNLGKAIDRKFIRTCLKYYWNTFSRYVRSELPNILQPSELYADFSPDVLYHLITYHEGLSENISDNTDGKDVVDPENISPFDTSDVDIGENEERFITQIIFLAEYFENLEKNSYGQNLFLMNDPPKLSAEPFSLTEYMKGTRKITEASSLGYTTTLSQVLESEKKSSQVLGNGILSLTICICIILLLSILITGENNILILILIIFLFILYWLHYILRNSWVENTPLLNSNLKIILEEIYTMMGEELPEVAQFMTQSL